MPTIDQALGRMVRELKEVFDDQQAAREARLLISYALEIPHLEVRLHGEKPLAPETWETLREGVRRLKGGEPLQYITGSQMFCGLRIAARPGVLIPRPETEELAMLALRRLGDYEFPRALDLCTGSGAIACVLASRKPDAIVDACDISKEALEAAKDNARRLGLSERICFFQGDLFEAVRGRRYHVIVSNPPYVARDQWEKLEDNVRLYEPKIALTDGGDGLGFYRRIAEEAPRHLEEGGTLLLEMGHDQADAVAALLQARFKHVRIHLDMQGVRRMAQARIVI
ncbi:MAG: peptide chain release factor N(5)-glutamine methyltransferase [Christensenellales bacterium]|jgi:release factor glutamine methyltransferase